MTEPTTPTGQEVVWTGYFAELRSPLKDMTTVEIVAAIEAEARWQERERLRVAIGPIIESIDASADRQAIVSECRHLWSLLADPEP